MSWIASGFSALLGYFATVCLFGALSFLIGDLQSSTAVASLIAVPALVGLLLGYHHIEHPRVEVFVFYATMLGTEVYLLAPKLPQIPPSLTILGLGLICAGGIAAGAFVRLIFLPLNSAVFKKAA